jgi:hypothetical protein
MTKFTISWPLKVAGIVALLGVAAFGLVGFLLWDFRHDTRKLWSQVRLGDTEISVRQRVGAPRREYEKGSAPSQYYESGYRHRDRPITARVLIYMGADLIFYVWIDEKGYVEDVFIGTS